MKTKDLPAMVMLSAGGVYCLIGILYRIPLMDFLVQLLIVLLIFWIFGGIIRMFLDRFMGEIEEKAKEDEAEETDEQIEGEDADESSGDEEADTSKGTSKE